MLNNGVVFDRLIKHGACWKMTIRLPFKAFKLKCQNLRKFVEQMFNLNLMSDKNKFSSSLGHNPFYMNLAFITPLLSV